MTPLSPRRIRHVLMDWDGTTSLVRSGWADLMTDLYLENLVPLPSEDPGCLRQFAWDEVMRLNGRPSIHQASRLVELVAERDGTPSTAVAYQDEFQRRLARRSRERLDRLRDGSGRPEELLVPGVREYLTHLRDRGVALTLATGTPLAEVTEEAALLGLAPLFEGRIFGPRDTHDTAFSKREVIARVLSEHGLKGSELMAFGDGPVEIAETAAVGGVAVAVASDESRPGQLDEWKRDALLAAGAHAVIAHYGEAPAAVAGWGLG